VRYEYIVNSGKGSHTPCFSLDSSSASAYLADDFWRVGLWCSLQEVLDEVILQLKVVGDVCLGCEGPLQLRTYRNTVLLQNVASCNVNVS
jgi:hypothetical protein